MAMWETNSTVANPPDSSTMGGDMFPSLTCQTARRAIDGWAGEKSSGSVKEFDAASRG